MPEVPLVTIGVANYNYGRYIKFALDSIIHQDYSNIEIIIVDDSSTDNSAAVIEDWISKSGTRFEVHFIRTDKNVGIAKVSNLILKNAKGKFYQILDADDTLLPNKISRQVGELELNEKYALVYSNISVIDEANELVQQDYLASKGYNTAEMPAGRIFKPLLKFNFIPNCSVLIKTSCANEVGGYDESLQVQDYYLYLTLSEHYEVKYITDVTACYRIHTNSLSNTRQSNTKSIESVMSLLYRYRNKVDKESRLEILRNIHFSTPYLYEYNDPTSALWLRRDFLLNPGFKSFIYFVAQRACIPYSFFLSVRKFLKN